MSRNKKVIIGSILVAVILVGSMVGIVLAADTGDGAQPGARFENMFNRVAEIYQQKTGTSLDQAALKESFAEARNEICPEGMKNHGPRNPEDMQNRFQSMVEQGKLTQEQVDALKQWKDARPDIPLPFGKPRLQNN